MAAIDVLLNWSPTSERIHQFVLAGLFQHTKLLDILGIKGTPKDNSVETETCGRLFDFTVTLDANKIIYVELKVDANLNKEQITRQIEFINADNILVYLLLGTTRFQWDENKIRNVCKETNNPHNANNVLVFHLDDIIRGVDSLAARSIDKNYSDYRDLSASYGTLLRTILKFTSEFESKEVKKWKYYDWHGYFDSLNRKLSLNGGFGYVPNPNKGFVGFWWGGIPLNTTTEAYLQLEEESLCFKISVEAKDQQSQMRNSFQDAIIASAKELNFPVERPKRLGKGYTMTVALFQGKYTNNRGTPYLDWEDTKSNLKAAEEVLKKAVSKISL